MGRHWVSTTVSMVSMHLLRWSKGVSCFSYLWRLIILIRTLPPPPFTSIVSSVITLDPPDNPPGFPPSQGQLISKLSSTCSLILHVTWCSHRFQGRWRGHTWVGGGVGWHCATHHRSSVLENTLSGICSCHLHSAHFSMFLCLLYFLQTVVEFKDLIDSGWIWCGQDYVTGSAVKVQVLKH